MRRERVKERGRLVFVCPESERAGERESQSDRESKMRVREIKERREGEESKMGVREIKERREGGGDKREKRGGERGTEGERPRWPAPHAAG